MTRIRGVTSRWLLAVGGVVVAVAARDRPGLFVDLAAALAAAGADVVGARVATAADGMALDDRGDIFLVGSSSNELEELSPTGQLLQRWTLGGPGQPDRPYAVAWDGQARAVYVASSRTLFRLDLSS